MLYGEYACSLLAFFPDGYETHAEYFATDYTWNSSEKNLHFPNDLNPNSALMGYVLKGSLKKWEIDRRARPR